MFKKIDKSHFTFIGVLAAFSILSVYALISYFISTNEYVHYMQASIVAADETEKEAEEVVYGLFSDVGSDHKNAIAIEKLKYEGILEGYDDGTFKPENFINRVEFLAVLTDAVDADFSVGTYENCFEDVKTEWYATFVCYAKAGGWISGYADGTYKPNNFVIYAEGLKVLMTAFAYEIPDFEGGEWYAGYVNEAVERGFIDEGVDPLAEMTRAQMAELLFRVMEDQQK
ncbi:S-layer homology domain-containing protein [Patescibacteria group bacterium]|nr:S-layer homology domain-containing protein [Patescibacteria group bacterium]